MMDVRKSTALPRSLTPEEIGQFVDRGYVLVRQAFPRDAALAAQTFLWERIAEAYPETGLRADDPATWKDVIARDAAAAFPTIHLRALYNDPVFKACETPRLAGAIEDLVGRGRWALKDKPHNWGWWPVNFGVGAATPWTVPTQGWHWDGMGRLHFVHSPEQGLLVLPCFSDVGPQAGGTLIAAGSHQVVARYLARHPDGRPADTAIAECAAQHPWLAALTGHVPGDPDRVTGFVETETVDDHGTRLQVVPLVAQAGDVVLGHPFLFHAASQNHSGRPRFMCNRAAPLTEPMRLERPDGDYSVLERSIRAALAA